MRALTGRALSRRQNRSSDSPARKPGDHTPGQAMAKLMVAILILMRERGGDREIDNCVERCLLAHFGN